MAREICINPWEYSCLYFCPHFHRGYKDNTSLENICARYFEKEAIFYCSCCLKKLLRFISHGSPRFFAFAKSMLIQYYVPIKECNRVIVAVALS